LTNASPANTSGAFTLSANDVTVTQAGTYLVSPGVLLNNALPGDVFGGVVELRVNGTSVPGTGMQLESPDAPTSVFVSCSVVVNLQAGDVLNIANAGGAAIGVGSGPPFGATNAGDVAVLTIAKLG
jgi:hypothetical protein